MVKISKASEIERYIGRIRIYKQTRLLETNPRRIL